MTKVAVLAKLPINPDAKDAFVAAFAAMEAAVAEESGTEIYILNWDAADENLAYIYELYTESDALGVHSGSEAMKALMGALGGLLAGAPELIMLNPASGKGL
jgi:quinol monooxygenase YgiN